LVLNARFATTAGILAAELEKASGADRAQLLRLLRWQRQSVARVLLPEAAVSKCYRVRRRPAVDVNYSRRVKRAHYAGLVTCASVWDCPVCSSKITERRRQEIESADTSGLHTLMVTFTLQHSRDDRLSDVRSHLARAYRTLKQSGWWKRFVDRWEIVGSVAAVEVTYGVANGWHPHRHVLMWSKMAGIGLVAEAMRSQLARRFSAILEAQGRYADFVHGVDVRAGDQLIAEYVAKWGHDPVKGSWSLAAEITKGGSKTLLKAADHYTPFQLLDLHLAGDVKAGLLFREYASAMFRTKQLVWSRGTRELLGLNRELSDEELASAQEEDAALFAQLTPAEWTRVLQLGQRGHLIEIASRNDQAMFAAWLGGAGIRK